MATQGMPERAEGRQRKKSICPDVISFDDRLAEISRDNPVKPRYQIPPPFLLNGSRQEGSVAFRHGVKLPTTNVFVMLTVDKSPFEQSWALQRARGASPPRTFP